MSDVNMARTLVYKKEISASPREARQADIGCAAARTE